MLFWESETVYEEESPRENMLGKIASLPWFLGKIHIPKTARSFLLDPDTPQPL